MQKTKFLNRNINTIFIMLGNECNLSCKYCLQHALVKNPISHEINPDIYDFIEEVCSEKPENDTLQIQFFGGEPLLFFENIKSIVAELEKRNLPIRFSVMTNGKLMNQEMVDFFNSHEVFPCVSYDGKNVMKTRGYDPFQKGSKHRELLLKLNSLGVSAVLSAYNYPKDICKAFQEIDYEYKKIHGYHLYMNVDDLMDFGSLPEDLKSIDYDRVSKEVLEMTLEYLQDRVEGNVPEEHYARNVYIHEKYNRLVSYYFRDVEDEEYRYNGMICCCGNGYSTYNLGLDGTLYSCHDISDKCGTIYDSYLKYLRNILRTDSTRVRRDTCKNCTAIAYCGGGCKLIPDKMREKYCTLRKAVFEPILYMVQEYGNQIEKVKKGN